MVRKISMEIIWHLHARKHLAGSTGSKPAQIRGDLADEDHHPIDPPFGRVNTCPGSCKGQSVSQALQNAVLCTEVAILKDPASSTN